MKFPIARVLVVCLALCGLFCLVGEANAFGRRPVRRVQRVRDVVRVQKVQKVVAVQDVVRVQKIIAPVLTYSGYLAPSAAILAFNGHYARSLPLYGYGSYSGYSGLGAYGGGAYRSPGVTAAELELEKAKLDLLKEQSKELLLQRQLKAPEEVPRR